MKGIRIFPFAGDGPYESISSTGPVCNLAWLFAGVKLQKLFQQHRMVISLLMALSLVYCAISLVS